MPEIAEVDVFTKTVGPLLQSAKQTGAEPAALTDAFLRALDSLYGNGEAKNATAKIGFQHILAQEGGSVAAAAAAKLYGGGTKRSDEAVRKAARLGQMIAVRDGLGALHFPVWQFGPRGGVLPGLRDVLDILRLHPHFDDLMPVTFFLNPSARLDDRSPLEALRGNDPADLEVVKQLAAAAAE